jgi:hypothetical protein
MVLGEVERGFIYEPWVKINASTRLLFIFLFLKGIPSCTFRRCGAQFIALEY